MIAWAQNLGWPSHTMTVAATYVVRWQSDHIYGAVVGGKTKLKPKGLKMENKIFGIPMEKNV